MKVAIGSDHIGFELKQQLLEYVKSLGHEVVDFGCAGPKPVDYPDVAKLATSAIASGQCQRGVLICGTGIGMAMAANKVRGIRAAQCHDVYSAERAALSNDAHVITLGALIVGPQVARSVVKTWLELSYKDGPSTVKIRKIMELEQR